MMNVARNQTELLKALQAERVSKAMHEEIDAAEADAAFRAAVVELCTSYGMYTDDKPYFFLKRKLAQRNEPDLRMICELAKVCVDNGIQEGEDPATFLESKCREVLRLTDELESTQHKLADAVSDAESDYDEDDCVQECMAGQSIIHDIHVNTSKCVAELIDRMQAEHKSTRDRFNAGVSCVLMSLLALTITVAAIVISL